CSPSQSFLKEGLRLWKDSSQSGTTWRVSLAPTPTQPQTRSLHAARSSWSGTRHDPGRLSGSNFPGRHDGKPKFHPDAETLVASKVKAMSQIGRASCREREYISVCPA